MTVPVEVKLSKLHNCLWKSSCQKHTTKMHIHKISNQTNLTENNRKNIRDSEQSCVSLPTKQQLRDYGSMPVSCTEAHTTCNICLICLRGIKLNNYLYASSNKPLHFADFVLQQNLAKNSVFKGIYSYYSFNTVALISHPLVFSH